MSFQDGGDDKMRLDTKFGFRAANMTPTGAKPPWVMTVHDRCCRGGGNVVAPNNVDDDEEDAGVVICCNNVSHCRTQSNGKKRPR
jgi:hypothetical protein